MWRVIFFYGLSSPSQSQRGRAEHFHEPFRFLNSFISIHVWTILGFMIKPKLIVHPTWIISWFIIMDALLHNINKVLCEQFIPECTVRWYSFYFHKKTCYYIEIVMAPTVFMASWVVNHLEITCSFNNWKYWFGLFMNHNRIRLGRLPPKGLTGFSVRFFGAIFRLTINRYLSYTNVLLNVHIYFQFFVYIF